MSLRSPVSFLLGVGLLCCVCASTKQSDLTQKMIRAVSSQDLPRVKYLLKKRTNPNLRDSNHLCPLQAAIATQNPRLVSMLLNAGANPNAFGVLNKESPNFILDMYVNYWDSIPMLSYAAGLGDSSIVDALLRRGADVSILFKKRTALDHAAEMNQLPVCRMLLRKQPRISEQELVRAANHAIKNKAFQVLEYLLPLGGIPDNASLCDAAGSAAFNNDTLSLKTILSYKSPIDSAAGSMEYPLNRAAYKCNIEAMELLLNAKSNINTIGTSGETPLLSAVRGRCTTMISLLLKRGASINASDSEGRSAVMLSSMEMLPLLIKHNANINMIDKKGLSPLHKAIREQYWEKAVFLINAGANVSTVSLEGETPVGDAIYGGNFSVVRMLMDHHAPLDVIPKNKNTWSVLKIAISSNGYRPTMEEFEYLLKHGKTIVQSEVEGKALFAHALKYSEWEKMALLIRYGAPIAKTDIPIQLLFWVVANQRADYLGMLLQKGVDLNQLDDETKEPIIVKIMREYRWGAMELLFKNGVKVNSKDRTGTPLLLIAIRNYQIEAVKLILQYQDNAQRTDTDSSLVAEYQRKYPYPKMAHLISSKGKK